jgi:hypothetical protein
MTTSWNLQPGDVVKRSHLHDEFGGRRRGGISMSVQTPNVMLFTSEAGLEYGYEYDGWSGGEEHVFLYTGEGQKGDQVLKQGNGAILNHKAQGRTLRLFEALGDGNVRYIGSPSLDEDDPYEIADAPEVGKGRERPVRSVYVFRLLFPPGGYAMTENVSSIDVSTGASEVDIEAIAATSIEVEVPGGTQIKQRREAELVERYNRFRRRHGLATRRHRIRPPGDGSTLFTDAYAVEEKRLLEAKGSTSRVDVRMAVGQLLDYRRFIDVNDIAVLLPSRPRQDLLDYLAVLDIKCVYETDLESGDFVVA